MKQQNFNDVVSLQDVYDITKKECDNGKGHTWARNLDLMNFASKSESIMELGVNQGTSLALMMLQNPKKIIGVDIDLNNWNIGAGFKPLAQIAKKYADENNIDLEMIQADSTDPVSTRNVDMLHIDSLHDPNHLEKELTLHSQYVKKYIAFHDIKQSDWALWKVVDKFLKNTTEWKIKIKYDEGKCGHAIIERTNYIDQYKIFYKNNGYGNNDPVIAAKDTIRKLIEETKSNTLLDYGCGHGLQYSKHHLHDYWKIKEDNLCKYDPAIPKFENLPTKKFDAVINTDVMEHIPIEHVDDIIKDIFDHAKKLVYFRIAKSSAKAILPNGENAHCTLLTHDEWLERILPYRSNQKVVIETVSKKTGSTITYHV